MLHLRNVLLSILLANPLEASAYIGPGMGLGAIGVVVGIFFALVLALVSIIWYPIKHLWKRLMKDKSTTVRDSGSE